jgi:queuosine precursor transporter
MIRTNDTDIKSIIFENKAVRLFFILGGFFIANALIAEFLGVKIFSVEKTLGLEPSNFTLWGQKNLSFNMAAGVLLWPIVFVMTDIINEYFGQRGVRTLSYLTAGLIAYGFFMFYLGIKLAPADFWVTSHITRLPLEQQEAMRQGVGNYNTAFGLVFGQGNWIIVGSLSAFLFSQIVDVLAFHKIKQLTGEGKIWLRSTGSTAISQFVDSYIVLFIAFYLPGIFDFKTIIVLGTVAYSYKLVVAILMTPIIYLIHYAIERYLGEPLASELKRHALNQ